MKSRKKNNAASAAAPNHSPSTNSSKPTLDEVLAQIIKAEEEKKRIADEIKQKETDIVIEMDSIDDLRTRISKLASDIKQAHADYSALEDKQKIAVENERKLENALATKQKQEEQLKQELESTKNKEKVANTIVQEAKTITPQPQIRILQRPQTENTKSNATSQANNTPSASTVAVPVIEHQATKISDTDLDLKKQISELEKKISADSTQISRLQQSIAGTSSLIQKTKDASSLLSKAIESDKQNTENLEQALLSQHKLNLELTKTILSTKKDLNKSSEDKIVELKTQHTLLTEKLSSTQKTNIELAAAYQKALLLKQTIQSEHDKTQKQISLINQQIEETKNTTPTMTTEKYNDAYEDIQIKMLLDINTAQKAQKELELSIARTKAFQTNEKSAIGMPNQQLRDDIEQLKAELRKSHQQYQMLSQELKASDEQLQHYCSLRMPMTATYQPAPPIAMTPMFITNLDGLMGAPEAYPYTPTFFAPQPSNTTQQNHSPIATNKFTGGHQ